MRIFSLSFVVVLALVFAGCVSYDRPRHFKTARCPQHMPGWFAADPHHAPHAQPQPPPPPHR